MESKPYVISDKVLEQFVRFHESTIKKIIINEFYPKNIINYFHNQVCFTFNEERFFVYKVDCDFLVSDLNCFNYDHIITMEFLNQFYFIRNILPPRLKQWVNDEHLSMLKNEIIEALKCNKMMCFCDSSKRVVFEWKTYSLKFELSNDFTFTNILLN